MTQRQIESAARRKLKTSYKLLNPQEKRLVKLSEREAILEKDIDRVWRTIYFHQKPPYLPENTSETVQVMLDLVLKCEHDLSKVRESKDRHIEKHGLNEDKIIKLHQEYNRGRCSGSSF